MDMEAGKCLDIFKYLHKKNTFRSSRCHEMNEKYRKAGHNARGKNLKSELEVYEGTSARIGESESETGENEEYRQPSYRAEIKQGIISV